MDILWVELNGKSLFEYYVISTADYHSWALIYQSMCRMSSKFVRKLCQYTQENCRLSHMYTHSPTNWTLINPTLI